MKALLPLLLLSLLAVSCGNKNSTGNSKGNSEIDFLENTDTTYLTYSQEQSLERRYLSLARSVLANNKSKIIRRYGRYTFDLIKTRLNTLNIQLTYQRIIDLDTNKTLDSFYDGYTLLLYIGNEVAQHNWKLKLRERNESVNAKIYEDLISLRTNGGYRRSNSFYRKSSSSANGGNASFHYEFSL
jgi:hypothetical protein